MSRRRIAECCDCKQTRAIYGVGLCNACYHYRRYLVRIGSLDSIAADPSDEQLDALCLSGEVERRLEEITKQPPKWWLVESKLAKQQLAQVGKRKEASHGR